MSSKWIKRDVPRTIIKNRVGDDGVPAILQYRPSDLYLTDRKETMKNYPHSSPHLKIRLSLVHPFLPQDKLLIQMHLDVSCNTWASCSSRRKIHLDTSPFIHFNDNYF